MMSACIDINADVYVESVVSFHFTFIMVDSLPIYSTPSLPSLPVCLSVCPSICLSVCPSVCLSVCLCLSQ